MATVNAGAKASFSYIWNIENYSGLTYIDLKSPSFVIKSIGDTVWNLKLNQYDAFDSRHVIRRSFQKKSNSIEVEFSFLGADGFQLISSQRSTSRLIISLMNTDGCVESWGVFTPKDTLAVKCRMWRTDREIQEDVCYARTRLQTYTGSFIWAIEEFRALKSSVAEDVRELASDERKVYPMKAFSKKGPFNALVVYVKQFFEFEDIYAEFLIEKGRNYTFSCELSVLDANGKVIASKIRRCRTHNQWTILTYMPLISKNELINNKHLFLQNDTLVLKCSFEVCTGEVSSELEYFTPNVASVTKRLPAQDFDESEDDDSLEFEEFYNKERNQNSDNI